MPWFLAPGSPGNSRTERLSVLVAYVSGHGFGHATRTAEVLRVLRERAPAVPITVCTQAPPSLFDVVGGPLSVRAVACDVGLVQRDALTIDEAASAAAVTRFLASWNDRVAAEARFLRESGARLVFGDIPPLAFGAAAAAGVPSVALGNFSWDWIYGHLGRRHAAFVAASANAAAAYAQAGLLLRLPFSCDLAAFPRILDVPLVARRPAVARPEARGRLGLGAKRVVLLSFGGVGMPGLQPAGYGRLGDYSFILTGRAGDGPAPANLRRIESAELTSTGLGYPDLVGAADVVVSKPGYGIVTDCIGAGTRLVYTDRGDFPEYPVLVEEMPRYLPVAFATNQEVLEGRLEHAIAGVLAASMPAPPATDGACVAADELLRRL